MTLPKNGCGPVLRQEKSWRAQPVPFVEWLTAIALPEIVYVAAASALWRHRRFMAAGIVLSAITLIIHFVVHVAA